MHDVVFLFDVDNTLLDNDHVQRDLNQHLASEYGPEARDRYWALFEDLRGSLGYADYLGALQRYRLEDLHNPKIGFVMELQAYTNDTKASVFSRRSQSLLFAHMQIHKLRSVLNH